LLVAGAAAPVAARLQAEANPAYAQVTAAPLAGHFHPKGKAPSSFTIDVLRKAKEGLPFGDTKDFEEQQKGLIATMPELKIMADAGHVAWDMERFQFLDEQAEFDSIHPSLVRQSVLNMNYGLYEVIPGIYQVRGFDLSNSIRGSRSCPAPRPSPPACRSPIPSPRVSRNRAGNSRPGLNRRAGQLSDRPRCRSGGP